MYYKYDSLNRVYESKLKLNGIGLKTGFVYGNSANTAQKPNLIYGVTLNGSEKINYRYDNFNRLSTRILNTTTPFVTKYGYLEGASSNETTTLVKTVKNGNTVLEYAYDQLGNITSIKKNGTLLESYEYDSLNQLTRVTNSSGVYVYTYDNGGNILSVTKNGTVIKTYEYIGEDDYDYGNTGWKDLLISFNGQEIYYDSGNPHFYRKYMLTWQNGRQLQTLFNCIDNTTINYDYDGEGNRISKTVGEVTTEYYWLNGILQGQKTGDEHIVFLYDENGTAYGMLVKNGATENYYYYVFNLQGDVIGILDSDGNEVVQYTYDVWGDLLSITGTLADTIGQKNPIRYRGYYYDNETGFYYLQSRYYDPEVGRFINADNVIAGVNGEILGYNQFAYCMNNPVNQKEITAQFFVTSSIVTTATVVCTEYYSISLALPASDVGAAMPYIYMPGSDDKTSPNCYSYAIGSLFNEQPGNTSGRIPTRWYDVYDVGKSVEADLRAKGYTIRKISGPNSKVYNNEFKIALRVGTQPYQYDKYTGRVYYDYHFMRQTNTGQWAEKHGIGGSSVLWDVGMTPDTIPWTLGDMLYYDSAIIYYAVGNRGVL